MPMGHPIIKWQCSDIKRTSQSGPDPCIQEFRFCTTAKSSQYGVLLREQHLILVPKGIFKAPPAQCAHHAHPPADVLNALKMRGPPPQHVHTYPQWSSGHTLRTTPEDVNYVEQRQPTPKEHAPPEVQAYLGSIPAKALSLSGGSQGNSSLHQPEGGRDLYQLDLMEIRCRHLCYQVLYEGLELLKQ